MSGYNKAMTLYDPDSDEDSSMGGSGIVATGLHKNDSDSDRFSLDSDLYERYADPELFPALNMSSFNPAGLFVGVGTAVNIDGDSDDDGQDFGDDPAYRPTTMSTQQAFGGLDYDEDSIGSDDEFNPAVHSNYPQNRITRNKKEFDALVPVSSGGDKGAPASGGGGDDAGGEGGGDADEGDRFSASASSRRGIGGASASASAGGGETNASASASSRRQAEVEEALARARALLGERKEGTKHGVKVREGGVPTEEVIAKREARKQELEKKGLPAFRRSVKAREELAKAEVPVPKDEQVVSNIRKWLTANPQNPYTKEIESAVNDAVRKGLTQEEINKLIELMEGRVGVKLLTGVVKAQRSVRDIIARRNTLLREMMSAKLGRSVSADEVGDAMGVSKGGDKGTVVSGESTSIGRTADPSGGGMSVAGEPVAFKLNGDVKGMLYVETQPSTGQEWIMFKAEGEEKYSRKTAKDIELLEGMINTIKAQYGAEALPTVRNAIGRKITQGKYEKRVASGEQPPRPSRAGGRAKGKGKAKAETVAEVVGGK